MAEEVAIQERLGRRRHVHDGRPHHAPARVGHRLWRSRIPDRPRADSGVERRLSPWPRILDQCRERHRRPIHRHHLVRLLNRQRSPGGGVVECGDLVRWRGVVHLRRPHHVPPAPRLSALLRDPPHAAHAGPVLDRHGDRRAGDGRDLRGGRPRSCGAVARHRSRSLLVGLHDVSQHRLSCRVRRFVLGVPEPVPLGWRWWIGARPRLRYAGRGGERPGVNRARGGAGLFLLRPLPAALRRAGWRRRGEASGTERRRSRGSACGARRRAGGPSTDG